MAYIAVSSLNTEKIIYAHGNYKEVEKYINNNKEFIEPCEITIYQIEEIKKFDISINTIVKQILN